MSSTEVVIQLSNADIHQGGNVVLHDVNISINAGEFIYLIGRTGSGKSSLLKTLYGDLPLKKGRAKSNSLPATQVGNRISRLRIAHRQNSERQPGVCTSRYGLDG